MTPSDDELVSRAKRGEREALSALLERHAPAVRRSLEGTIPRRWRALLTVDDVLQSAFTDTIVDLHRFVPVGEGAFAAWLVTLAQRNRIDALRLLEARKRGGDRPLATAAPGQDSLDLLESELRASTGSSPSRHAARAEAREALESAIARLPDAHRFVVERYDLRGERVEEVAAALRRTPGAVFLLRLRAHRKLRELLGSDSRFLSTS